MDASRRLALLASSLAWLIDAAFAQQASPYSPQSLEASATVSATPQGYSSCRPFTVSSSSGYTATTTLQCVAPYPQALTTHASLATPTIPAMQSPADGPNAPWTTRTPPVYSPAVLTPYSSLATPVLPPPDGSTGSPIAYPSPAALSPYESIATPTLPWRPHQTSVTTIPSTFTPTQTPTPGLHIAEPANLPSSTSSPIIHGTTLTPGAPAVIIHSTTYSIAPLGDATYINGIPDRPTPSIISEGDFGDVISSIFGFETITTDTTISTGTSTASPTTTLTTTPNPTPTTPSTPPETPVPEQGKGIHGAATNNLLLLFILATLATT